MSTSALAIAEQALLSPSSLDHGQLDNVIGKLMGPSIDAADLYFQYRASESWALDDGIVKDASHSIEKGVGLRAISGETTGLSYSDALHLPALLEAASSARAIARDGKQHQPVPVAVQNIPQRYAPVDPVDSIAADDKVRLLKEIDAYARGISPLVNQVSVGVNSQYEVVLIANQEGRLVADIRPLVRFNVMVIVEQNGRREQGFAGSGGRYAPNYEDWRAEGKKLADEAVRTALVNLEAVDAPAGTMPVVLGPGWPGVLLHEAVGHGLEGDFNRKGSSAFAGKMGQQVASKLCTVVDDGTLPDRRGSLTIDDEGTPTQATTLIENGILVGYMQDSLNARLMGTKSTGNGRRESFAHMTMPRMTNTFMQPGPHDPHEIIASVKKGIYAVNFAGGQVDITSGKFVFSASEAYLIENGKVTRPVKGATLIGSGPEAMQQISMVGNDLALDRGIGVCGKEGQSVPVGVGQPSLKIDAITVGGTAS